MQFLKGSSSSPSPTLLPSPTLAAAAASGASPLTSSLVGDADALQILRSEQPCILFVDSLSGVHSDRASVEEKGRIIRLLLRENFALNLHPTHCTARWIS